MNANMVMLTSLQWF